MSDNVRWLTTVPATDVNFKGHLKTATTEEIKEALSIITGKGEKGNVSRIAALSKELRKRDKELRGIGKYHECETINKFDKISIEKINGSWTWIFWSDKNGNRGHGIRYCPYCGKDLISDDK